MKRAFLPVIVLFLFIVAPRAWGQDDCAGFTPQLVSGRVGIVTPGGANNVRAAPVTGAAVVGQLEPGEQFAIINGPICADDYTWWEVATQNLTGFTVEGSGEDYWVELIPAQDLDALAAAFSFDFTPIAQNVTLHAEPEETTDSDSYGPRPPSLTVEFAGVVMDNFLEPRIDIWPVESFRAVGNERYADLLAYGEALQTAPAAIDTRPFMPRQIINAGRIFEGHQKVIAFNGGNGYRYIAQYAQYAAPIRSYELFYTFQGMTADNAYYLSVILPLDTLPLRQFEYDYVGEKSDNNGVSPEYDEASRAFVTALADDDFLPSLTTLDALVGSIRLDGLGAMPDMIDRYNIENIALDYSHISDSTQVDVLGPDGQALAYYNLGGGAYIVAGNTQQALHDWLSLAALYDVLENRPTAPEAYAMPLRYGPYRPLGNIEFIETDHLRGVRFLLHNDSPDDHTPITNPLEYVFQGISQNGWYKITGYFPITTPLLPAAEEDLDAAEDEAAYREYTGAVIDTINNAPPADFFPCLDDLDAIFETMTFDGTVIERGPACASYTEPIYQFNQG
ncbi:hypothetical protein ACFLYO_06670 [Chloroflexota bacterium]